MAEPHGKMRDLHCQTDDLSRMLENLRCQPNDSDFQMNDIAAGKFNRGTIEI